MSDAEWNDWQSAWNGEGGALPDVRERARKDATRHRRAMILFLSLMAVGATADIAGALKGNDPVVALTLVAWSVVLCAGLLWIQRGAALEGIATPREALAFLERRVRIERQGASLVRWFYPPMMIFVAFYYRHLFGDDAWIAILVARAFVVGMIALAFSAPWLIRRITNRQEAEIARWRRWLDDQQL